MPPAALHRKFVRFLPENGAFLVAFLPYARFFRSSKGAGMTQVAHGKYATANIARSVECHSRRANFSELL